MDCTIRLAGPDDAATIHDFICRLAEYEREPGAVKATPSGLREQMASANSPFECLLAERDGIRVGFALFFHNYSTWRGRRGIWLEDLFVPPEHRGSGIGKALLERLARLAIERDCARLEWLVLDWNQPAFEFYRSLGAEPLSEWTAFRLTGEALARLGGGERL